jgi:hypothetical protein
MNVRIPSYEDKQFTILDNLALIRDPNNLRQTSHYKEGDVLLPGKRIGDQKVIPMMTKVRVTGVRTDDDRNAYAFAEPAEADSPAPSGWTRVTNFAGQMLNELAGYTPAEWELRPMGKNYTVTDLHALIRDGSPTYDSRGETIPPGTFVVVTARSSDTEPAGKFVRVSLGEIADGVITAVRPLGWTMFSNLTEGCSSIFSSDAWINETGPNACWRSGVFIGAKILVDIIGTGGQNEQITIDSLPAYTKLKDAAARKNIGLGITSGFRTFLKQKKLFDLFQQGQGNLAARPGRSNHQHGQAIDLNTGGFDGDPVYDWLKKNGPKNGFIRTVNREHWHWEYRPEDAARLDAVGKFALSNVRV